MQIETVSLIEVIAAARARQASLVPETAGYLMLALGRALANVPMRLDLDHVRLSTEGSVTLDGPKQALSSRACVGSLQRLLTELLDLSKGYAPALRAAAEARVGEDGLEALFGAIATSLIPINRAAAKRALARLARETLRAVHTGTLERPSLDLDDLQRRSDAQPSHRQDERRSADQSPRRRARRDSSLDAGTPSPPQHSATLTPTFVDTDISTDGMSFREEVMRDVVGFIAGDARKKRESERGTDPDIVEGQAASSPSKQDEARQSTSHRVGASAIDVLDRRFRSSSESTEKESGRREASSRVPKRFVPKRDKVLGRSDDAALPYAATSVETLLERFAEAPQDVPSLRQVEKSLGQLGSLHMTPVAPSSEELPRSGEFADGRPALPGELDGEPVSVEAESLVGSLPSPEPSRASATPSGQTFGHGQSSVPPLFLERISRNPRRVFAGLGALFVLGASVVALALVRPDLIQRVRGSAAAPAAAPVCRAEVTLTNLPERHELLLRLGAAPFTTTNLPKGVRLELIATAAGHQPKRIVVEEDADWSLASGALALDATLDPGPTSTWPAAPAGEVGGKGPAGSVSFSATPAATELWLVLHAGEGTRKSVALPCGTRAELIALDPAEPNQFRRAQLEPELLTAAARTGDAEVAMLP